MMRYVTVGLSVLAGVALFAGIARAAGIVLGWHDRGFVDTDRKLRKHVRRFREARPFW